MSNCLLLIDIQNDYFPGGKMELSGMVDAAAKAQKLLEEFRSRTLPVIHVQHISVRPGSLFFLPDSRGVEINDRVMPLADEPVITKNFPNSFRETALLETLRERGIGGLTICGAMSHMCIDATTRAAFDLGLTCVVADDACATRDLFFRGEKITAPYVHASFMAALETVYAEVLSTDTILRGITQSAHP